MSGYHYLRPYPANMPDELKKIPRWVMWQAIQKAPGAKPDKIPFRADLPNSPASTDDPSTWGEFEQANAALGEEDSTFTGIGFVLNGDDIAGVDIDDCADAETGEINPAAMALLDRLNAGYVEFSPSGKGLRAFGYSKPLERGRKGRLDGLNVEFYSRGRYLTLTGHALKRERLRQLVGFAEEAAKLDTGKKKDATTGAVIATNADERIAELLQRIRSGDVYHDSLRDLAASWAATGMKAGAIVNSLRALMRASDGEKDDRWKARVKEIPRLVESACQKFARPLVQREELRLLTADDVLALPPLSWRIKHVLPVSGLAAIYGPSGSGKSFLALDMLAAVADGRQWGAYRTYAAPVIYVCLEGEAGLAQRVKAHRQHHGLRAGASMCFVTSPFRLLEQNDVDELAKLILNNGGQGAVVCLDTLNQATPGADENSSEDMGRAIAAAKRLQASIGGLVVLVHHAGKDLTKGMRGHSSLFAALDAVIEVSRNGEARSWKVSKSKDGADGAEHQFRLERVELGFDDDLEAFTSCVVIAGGTPKARPLTKTQQGALQALVDACQEHGLPYPDKNVGGIAAHLDDWRKTFYRISAADNDEAKKKAFQRVRNDLTNCGAVSVADDYYRPNDVGVQASIVLTTQAGHGT
jgi:RecA/RadA recombinase